MLLKNPSLFLVTTILSDTYNFVIIISENNSKLCSEYKNKSKKTQKKRDLLIGKIEVN